MVCLKSLIPIVLCMALISESASTTAKKTTAKTAKLPSLDKTSSSSSSSHKTTKSGSSTTSASKSSITSHSSSSTSSSSHYTFTATIPVDTLKNPYIHNSSSPNGTIFISIGSIIGAIFVGFFGFFALSVIVSRMRNSSGTEDLFDDYEDKNFGYDPSIFGRYANKNNDASTIADFDNDKRSMFKTSANSVYSFGGDSTIGSNILLASGPIDDNVMTQQGRPLMNALLTQNNSSQALNVNVPNHNKANRKSRNLSMYISPLEMAMNQSQLGLQAPNSTFDPNSPNFTNSPISSNFPSSVEQNSPAMSSETKKEKKKVRPPSMYLDDLMDASFINDDTT